MQTFNQLCLLILKKLIFFAIYVIMAILDSRPAQFYNCKTLESDYASCDLTTIGAVALEKKLFEVLLISSFIQEFEHNYTCIQKVGHCVKTKQICIPVGYRFLLGYRFEKSLLTFF